MKKKLFKQNRLFYENLSEKNSWLKFELPKKCDLMIQDEILQFT